MTARYLRRPEPVFSSIGDELAILDLRAEKYHSVGPVGAVIWHAIAVPRSLEEVVEAVRGEFEVDEGQARADVTAFLAQLVEAGLAEVQAG